MTDDKWKDVLAKIKDSFNVLEHQTVELSQDDGPGTIEFIEFDGPLGKMRLERTTQPVVLDKKILGSRRIGSESTVQYKYSDEEEFHVFNAYKWDDNQDDWVKMEMERGTMIF